MKRRTFLKITAGMGAAAAVDPALLSRTYAGGRFRALSRTDPAAHIAHRLTFGPRPGLVDEIRALGVEPFIEQQLNPATIEDTEVERLLADFDVLTATPEELVQKYDEMRGEIVRQLIGATLLRAIYSRRYLHEMMVHFWSDHFNIYLRKGVTLFLKPTDDRDVIRQHALGNFRDLLGASARSPAMLFYLDNAASRHQAPNENYARELMELHTLGVTSAYTEQDVKEVARRFTGWTIVPPLRENRRNLPGDPGEFAFDQGWHDNDEKNVLGQIIPANGGLSDGEQVLDLLANHPSTAWFISLKLVRRFVADDPPPVLVERCTGAFLATHGDIPSVLRVIFASEEFWAATPKFRRPFEVVVAVLRALDYRVNNPTALYRGLSPYLENMGHLPFMHISPDGYPDLQSAWIGNLLPRWNLAFELTYGDLRGAEPGYETLLDLAGNPDNAPALIHFLADYLLGRNLTPDEETILFGFTGNVDLNTQEGLARIQDTLGLLLASPAFQYR